MPTSDPTESGQSRLIKKKSRSAVDIYCSNITIEMRCITLMACQGDAGFWLNDYYALQEESAAEKCLKDRGFKIYYQKFIKLSALIAFNTQCNLIRTTRAKPQMN